MQTQNSTVFVCAILRQPQARASDKGAVDLSRCKLCSVPGKPVCSGKLGRVKRPLPTVIGPAGGADQEVDIRIPRPPHRGSRPWMCAAHAISPHPPIVRQPWHCATALAGCQSFHRYKDLFFGLASAPAYRTVQPGELCAAAKGRRRLVRSPAAEPLTAYAAFRLPRRRGMLLFLLWAFVRGAADLARPPLTLCRRACMRSMTLERSSFSSGASMVCPAALRFTRLRSANSYSSLNLSGSKRPALESRI